MRMTMMRNVRDIVRDLRADTTVRPKKEAAPLPTEAPRPQIKTIPLVEKHGDVYRPKVPHTPVVYRERQEEPTYDVLEPECEHQWQWKSGKKTCWLCGGAAPVDRRDASTTWQAKVYGKK